MEYILHNRTGAKTLTRRYNLSEIFIDLSQNKVKMYYIFENCYSFGEVSALDGKKFDVLKHLSFTCTDRYHPHLSPIESQLENQSTRPSTTCHTPNINAIIIVYIILYYYLLNVVEQGIHLFYCLKIHEHLRKI